MSITPIKVRIVKRPIIKARFVPQLPANLTGRTAIAVERNGSIYYLDLDYSKLAESLSFDPAQNVVAILRSDGVWHKTTVATLSTMIGADKPNLVAIANAATAADKLGYWSGAAQYSLTDFTAYMRTLLDDPDATTARATLGLVIGTDVQPHDAELDALAGLVSAADRLPYFTGPGTAALTVLTPFARTLLDDADAAAMRATIDAQQRDSDLDAIAALTPTNDDFIQRKAGAWVNRSVAQVKTDLAINNVDNTSDLNKPISTATQGALDLKADKAITVSAGTGLTGGGDLSANRSVALNSASIASLGKADTAVQPARSVSTGTGLIGGGDLSADRTIALDTASQASLAKADTAVQPGALGSLAAKSKIDVPGDINATGTPSSSTYLRGDGVWAAGGGGGGGDLLAANNLSDVASADASRDNIAAAISDLLNISFAVSASAGALTIALKNAAGNDPSSNSPVALSFRSATQTSGVRSHLKVTAAQSITVPATSTLGFQNATAGRIWITGWDDGGTFRLGVFNASDSGNVYALNEEGIASSLQVVAAGNAVGQHYTAGAAVASRAFRILGYVEWSASGLTTAGTWTTTNLVSIQTFGPGVRKPGDVVQRRSVKSSNSSYLTTTSITYQNHPVLQQQISLSSAANLVRASCATTAKQSVAQGGCWSRITRGGSGNAVGAETLMQDNTSATAVAPVLVGGGYDKPNATSTTYYAQARSNVNGSQITFGEFGQSALDLEEIQG